MGGGHGSRAAQRFGRAAHSYSSAASLQAAVAAWLAESLPPCLPPGVIVDIGCGTGLFTAHLQRQYPEYPLLALDAAFPMALYTAQNIPGVWPLVADGARLPLLPGTIALIASSMTLQWLENPSAVLREWQRLLAPGGVVSAAWPVAGSFGAWYALLEAENLSPAFRFPAPLPGFSCRVFSRTYASLGEFWRSLRETGATASNIPGYRSLSPLSLRRLQQRWGGAPFTVEYIIQQHKTENNNIFS